MTSLLTYSIIIHVLTGVFGIGLVWFIFMNIMRETPNMKVLQYVAGFSFVSFIISWVTSGYYYVIYYGSSVKPIIKAGDYPWAHQIFMEGKEHIFLMLPFLALVIWVGTYAVAHDPENKKLKNTVAILTVVTAVLGAFVVASGIIVSGAAR